MGNLYVAFFFVCIIESFVVHLRPEMLSIMTGWK